MVTSLKGKNLPPKGANSFLYEQFLIVLKIKIITLSDLPWMVLFLLPPAQSTQWVLRQCTTALFLVSCHIYTQQKRNAPLRTVQLSGRSQVLGQFCLYQCKGKSVKLRHTSFAIWRRNCVKENWSWTKWGSNCKVTGNKRFNNALLLDMFKQLESSQ